MYTGGLGVDVVESPDHHNPSTEASHVIKEVVLVSPGVQPPLPPPISLSVLQLVVSSFRNIKEALASHKGLDAVHLVTHGTEGDISLGGEHITPDNATSFRDAFAAIGRSLNTSGELLLYGCNIAQGEQGLKLLQVIHGMAGASSVSGASHDVTVSEGNASCELDVTYPPRENVQPSSHLFDLADTGWIGALAMPVNNLPPDPNAIPNTGIPTSTSIPLSVTDTAGANLDVTLTVVSGTLNVIPAIGLTTSAGIGTTSLHLIGTIEDVNDTLATLSYTPTIFFLGNDTLTINTTDTDTADTAPLSTVTIHVFSAPENVLPPVDFVALQNIGGPIPFLINDTTPGANLNVTLSVTSGTLSVLDPMSIATGNGTNNLQLAGPLSDVNNALVTLGYIPNSSSLSDDTLTITTTDTVSTLIANSTATIHFIAVPTSIPSFDFSLPQNFVPPSPFTGGSVFGESDFSPFGPLGFTPQTTSSPFFDPTLSTFGPDVNFPLGLPSGPPPGLVAILPFLGGATNAAPPPAPDTPHNVPTPEGTSGAAGSTAASGTTGQTTTREPLAIKNVNLTKDTPPPGIPIPEIILRLFTGGTLGSHLGDPLQQKAAITVDENMTNTGTSAQARTKVKDNNNFITTTDAYRLQYSFTPNSDTSGRQQKDHGAYIMDQAKQAARVAVNFIRW